MRSRNGSGLRVKRYHAANIQVLDHDRLVFTNELSAEFMQAIAADIGNVSWILAT